MSAAPPPGARAGDRSHYDGRRLLGVTRGSVGGVTAFDASGKRIGAFATQKEASRAVLQRDRQRSA